MSAPEDEATGARTAADGMDEGQTAEGHRLAGRAAQLAEDVARLRRDLAETRLPRPPLRAEGRLVLERQQARAAVVADLERRLEEETR